MQTKETRIQAHGLTHGQLQDLRYEQTQGEASKITANKDSSVEIDAVNAHLIHVRLEMKSFNSATGEKQSVPFIQCFYPREFETMLKQGAFKGYSVEIVHEPKDAPKGLKKDIADIQDADSFKANSSTATPVVTPPSADQQSDAGTDAGTEEVDLSKLNKTELQAKYKERFDEPPAESMTKAELIEAISEF